MVAVETLHIGKVSTAGMVSDSALLNCGHKEVILLKLTEKKVCREEIDQR